MKNLTWCFRIAIIVTGVMFGRQAEAEVAAAR